MASAKKMMTFELLDKMDSLISLAKTVPFTKKIVLDKDEFTDLMRRLQESIPGDLQIAKKIVDQEEAILSESNKVAEETRARAASEATQTINQANQDARAAIESATAQANAAIADATAKADAAISDAQSKAGDTIRAASDQANAMLADAQARFDAMIADATAQAAKLVSENEIVIRAQAEAQDLLENAKRDCEELTTRTNGALGQLMDQADLALNQQVEALRAMRQDFLSNS